jgi:hypothetical protein
MAIGARLVSASEPVNIQIFFAKIILLSTVSIQINLKNPPRLF